MIVSAPATLHLNLHGEFFAAIATQKERIEYRSRTPHWEARLEGRHYRVIQFRNGYASKAPVALVEYRGYRIQGKGKKKEFAIRPGRVLKIKRWRKDE